MYRENEAGRVAAVREAVASGDRAAITAAAVEFWLAPVERAGEPHDGAAIEVRDALAAGHATALAGLLPAVRDGKLARPFAYIDLVESMTDPAAVLELARIAIERGHPVVPYLAAPFFTLVDLAAEASLLQLIDGHRAALAATTDRWVLVGTIMTMSRVGKTADLVRWFADLAARTDAPMWVGVAYCQALLQGNTKPMHLAGTAQALVRDRPRDATQGLPLTIVLLALLHARDLPGFLAMYDREHEHLAPGLLDVGHPLVVYINAAKHARAVDADDLAFSFDRYEAGSTVGLTVGLTALAVRTQGARPQNWRVSVLVREHLDWVENVARLLAYFPKLAAVERGDTKRAVALAREMRGAKPSRVPSIMPAWNKLLATKIGIFTRLRLAYT